MNTRIVKISLSVILFLLSIYLIVIGYIGWGILAIFISSILLLLYFRNEFNLLALFFMKRQNFDKAEKMLNMVKHPGHLGKRQEAYHYFLRGNIEAQKRNIGKAETWYKKALATGLRMKMDQAMAKLSLAAGAASRRRKREAMIHLQDAKKLDTHGMLTDQIKMLKEQMKRI